MKNMSFRGSTGRENVPPGPGIPGILRGLERILGGLEGLGWGLDGAGWGWILPPKTHVFQCVTLPGDVAVLPILTIL